MPDDPISLLTETFGAGPEPAVVSVPGRVNLIGEHIDYHNLPVLPIAIQRRIRIAFRRRDDHTIRAVSTGNFGVREFEWSRTVDASPAGDWANYVKAAAQAISGKWGQGRGIDAAIVSGVPPAAGLSSSSALITGMTLALLRANGIGAGFSDLMEVLPEGEYYVGTRGGGMDHAAVLAAHRGCALLIRFAPLSVADVNIPEDWGFLIAHSLTLAEKSSGLREAFNERRWAGERALERVGFASYREAVEAKPVEELQALASAKLDGQEAGSFLHVVSEAARVQVAVAAMKAREANAFARAVNESHASLRDLLRVSNSALDHLVEAALQAGALGARLTGAGFGGCAVVFCREADRAKVREGLMATFYDRNPLFDPDRHLIDAEPSDGALFQRT